MKVELICIGKTSKFFLEEGENEYLKRLKRYLKFQKIELPDIKMAKKMPVKHLLNKKKRSFSFKK